MPIQILVPELGESIVEATVSRWLKQEGEPVAPGEPLVELETDKVNLEVGSEHAGILVRIERRAGEDVRIGDVLGIVEEMPVAAVTSSIVDDARIAAGGSATPMAQPTPPATPIIAAARPTPTARRFAYEHNLSIPVGSPPMPPPSIRPAPPPPPPASPPPHATERPVKPAVVPPTTDRSALEERVRMSRRRQTIARRLVEAQHTAAMLTTFNEVDMTAVIEVRNRRKEIFKQRYGTGLGIVSFFVKAVIGALKEIPQLNAEIQGDEIVLKRYYDIGIAIGASEGLVVPVLRDADRMSFVDIEKAIKGFVQKAEDGTLSLDDLRGGTFTISNGGVYGSMLSTPILNPPQVGILGLHKIEERPIAMNGQVVIRPMMYVALSYDHRIVDGRESVRFLMRVKQLIEDPEALFLEA